MTQQNQLQQERREQLKQEALNVTGEYLRRSIGDSTLEGMVVDFLGCGGGFYNGSLYTYYFALTDIMLLFTDPQISSRFEKHKMESVREFFDKTLFFLDQLKEPYSQALLENALIRNYAIDEELLQVVIRDYSRRMPRGETETFEKASLMPGHYTIVTKDKDESGSSIYYRGAFVKYKNDGKTIVFAALDREGFFEIDVTDIQEIYSYSKVKSPAA